MSAISTLTEMGIDRGVRESDLSSKLKKIEEESQKESFSVKTIDGSSSVFFVFLGYGKRTEVVKAIRGVLREMKDSDSAIVILKSEDYATIERTDSVFNHPDERVCVFHISHVMHNITKHKWVPHHEKIGEREKKHIMKVYSIKDVQTLPQISVRDPVVKWYGWKTGDICKITRVTNLCPRSGPANKNIGSGTSAYISYRYVNSI